jgi:hypothetical protein
MTLMDLKLVHVHWGKKQGLVSLALDEVLAYASGRNFTFCTDGTHLVAYLTEGEMRHAYGRWPKWANVCEYLAQNPEKIEQVWDEH